MLPGIFKVVVDLARKYDISAVRMPRERLNPYMIRELSSALRIAEMTVLSLLSRHAVSHEINTTDYFVGYLFGGRLNTRNLHKVLSNLPVSGTCELMCHPAAVGASHHDHWNYDGESELEALIASETKGIIRDRQIRLISYRDLD